MAPDGGELALRDPAGEALRERVDGALEHVGVAELGEGAAGVAQGAVLPAVGLGVEAAAVQAQQGARLLEVLARLVDAGLQVAARRELVARVLEPLGGRALQRRLGIVGEVQAIGHADVLPGRTGGKSSGGRRPASLLFGLSGARGSGASRPRSGGRGGRR